MAVAGNEKGPLFGCRHFQFFLLFLVYLVAAVVRVNVSVTLVAMTNAKTTNPDFPEYKWNEKQKSLILSSFFWGYIVSVIPGSQICQKFGVKITLLVSVLGLSLVTLITPVCIPFGEWKIYCVIRTLLGLFQGPLYPCIYAHLSKWAPVEEQSRFGAMTHMGVEIGTIIAILFPGFVAKSSVGWPGISYISGVVGLIWSLFWFIFGENSPSVAKFISPEEKKFILASYDSSDTLKKKIPVPWKAIFSSVPFWSCLIVKMAFAWGYVTIQAEIPLYLQSVMQMDIKSNAIFSALPYIAMLLMAYVNIFFGDILMKRKTVSLEVLRKSFSTLAMWVPAAGFVVLGFLDKHQKDLAIVIILVAVGFNAGSTIGCSLNIMDLSPNHSASMIGIIFTIIGGVAVLPPLCAGLLLNNEADYTEWRKVFLVAAVICFLGNLQYIFFGQMKRQPWDDKNFLTKHEDKELEKLNQNKFEA